jgi:hypothetical protein
VGCPTRLRFESGGQKHIGGIFINGSKVGTAAETSAQDAALVASLALQHGCSPETIRHALARPGGRALLCSLKTVACVSPTTPPEEDCEASPSGESHGCFVDLIVADIAPRPCIASSSR